MDDPTELVSETGRFECELAVVLVHVELAAFRAGIRRGFGLVDRRGNVVHVENAGECQATEPGADDNDRNGHASSFRIGDRTARGPHKIVIGVPLEAFFFALIRMRRMLSMFAAGRILNLKTARSQCIDGMIFGIGAALEEELRHDPRTGKIVNHDLAEYHIPVNVDVPRIDVRFIEERDHAANPLQSKGIGELGISGLGAAIANAIYNACGVRVREYPITLDKILQGLPPV